MRPLAPPRRLAAVALLALAPFAEARAQWVTGLGEDAIVLPSGMVRTTVGGAFSGFDERFSASADGAPTSGRRGYGADLSFASLDGTALPGLAFLDAALGSLSPTALPGVTFGRFGVAADARRAELPVRFDVGIGRGVQLFVAGAYVQTRVGVGVTVDPIATGANLGLDPALADAGAAAANAALAAQLRAASEALQVQLAACGAGGGGAACARPDDAAALRAQLADAATGIEGSYATGANQTVGVVPLAGSSVATAVNERLAALAVAAQGYGVTALPADARPRHAAAPISPGALLALADTGSAALGLRPLRDARRYGISDIEVGARFRLLDPLRGRLDVADTSSGTRLRAALVALVRLPTGEADDPRDPLDVGTGDGQTDVEVGIAADVLRGRRFVGSVAARYGVQLADELERAIPSWGAFAPPHTVSRDLGDYLEVELTPRYALNDYLTLGAHYRFRSKGEDAYERVGSADPLVDDATIAALGVGTETRHHVFGGGIVFSTLPAYAQGRARWPIDVAYRRTTTLAGAGRLAERYTRDEMMLRVYLTPFARR